MLNERETAIRAVKVAALCPRCREGDLVFIADAPIDMDAIPIQFWHSCTACGLQLQVNGQRYPHVDFRDVN